ncbi:hypothetical protein [Geomonas agri]|uniref:hypothetical protein n=1 Tax=Geomonas agri TaxID=2873702 RepID=UPI001CD1C4EF|nr:hypothetical protein [Geomonas agri]
MSNRPAEFQTTDIDLSATIMTATGKIPAVLSRPGKALVTFEFADDDATRAVVFTYATGELVQPVKRFAACRSWLYRKAKEVTR